MKTIFLWALTITICFFAAILATAIATFDLFIEEIVKWFSPPEALDAACELKESDSYLESGDAE